MKNSLKKITALALVLSLGVSAVAAPASATWVQENNGKWWYYYDDNPSHYAKNGWKKINGSWYYFDQYGYMKTGWVLDQGKWYYMAQNGKMVTGWALVDGKFYYLQKDGSMACNQVIGNSYVNEHGVWVEDADITKEQYYSEFPSVPDFASVSDAKRIYYKSDDECVTYAYFCDYDTYKRYDEKLESAGFQLVDFEGYDDELVIDQIHIHPNGQTVGLSYDFVKNMIVIICFD